VERVILAIFSLMGILLLLLMLQMLRPPPVPVRETGVLGITFQRG